MRLVEGFVLRQTLDEWIAVPCGQSALRMSGLVSMNETGAFIFSALQQEHTEDTLKSLLLDNYDTDEETAAQDVRYFVEYLRKNNLLVEND
jgi:hypothetical protein